MCYFSLKKGYAHASDVPIGGRKNVTRGRAEETIGKSLVIG